MKQSLRHIGIVTEKIEDSIGFYSEFFNFSVVNDQVEKGEFISAILGKETCVRTVKMTCGDFMIELLSFRDYNASDFDLFTLGCTHIALTVESVDSIFKGMSERGFSFISSPKLSKDGNAKVCFLKDPNNNFFLEIVEVVE